jgi:hypothetical protein
MILAGILMAAIPALASAYVGPGAGITAIGSVLALLAGILLAIVGFIWYPLKRFFRSRSGKQDTAATQSTKEHQDDPDKS